MTDTVGLHKHARMSLLPQLVGLQRYTILYKIGALRLFNLPLMTTTDHIRPLSLDVLGVGRKLRFSTSVLHHFHLCGIHTQTTDGTSDGNI